MFRTVRKKIDYGSNFQELLLRIGDFTGFNSEYTLSWTLWNLQYVKVTLGNYYHNLFFFWLCETLLKLVTKFKIKCYCSYYNLFLEFLVIRRFSSFGAILCLGFFSSAFSFLQFKTCLKLNIPRKLVLLGCIIAWIFKIVLL